MTDRAATEAARHLPPVPLRHRGARGVWCRPRVLPAVLALAAGLLVAPPARGFEKVKVGDKMPAFTLKDTAGADAGLAAGQAHVIVLFKEGPTTEKVLRNIGKSWAAMKDKGVVYFGVYLGKGKPEEAKALAPADAGFPILMGTEELYGTLGVKALPTTIWIDKGGTIIHELNLAPFGLELEASEYALVALGEKKAEDAELAIRPQDAAPVSKEEAEAKKMYSMAMVLMERGMKDKAVAKLQEILKIDPGFCDAHILLGHVYLEDGKVDEAVKEFEYVIKCDPTSNDAKVGLGMAHAQKGETDKALEYFQAALKLNPKPEKVYYEMGKAYEKKNDLPKAVESYKLALKRLFGGQ